MTDYGYGDLGPARTLIAAVQDKLREKWPESAIGWHVFPEGLRLEMHPKAYMTFWADPYSQLLPAREENLEGVLGVPVKVIPDLPEGTFRLVIVTEDVIMGGELSP